MRNTCDKCNKPVDKTNDAVRVEAIASGNYVMLLMKGPRHFLPTESCPGSPSRAQYIEGQPRDTRAQYSYERCYEALYRDAYAELQKEK